MSAVFLFLVRNGPLTTSLFASKIVNKFICQFREKITLKSVEPR